MTKSRVVTALVIAASLTVAVAFQAAQKAAGPADPLMAGFYRSTVASVSDAVDQITGKRGFMSFDMRPYIPGKVVGRANTALVRSASPEKATPAGAVCSVPWPLRVVRRIAMPRVESTGTSNEEAEPPAVHA